MTFTIDSNFFAGVKEADTGSRYPDAPAPGRYLVRIDQVEADKTQPKQKGAEGQRFFRIEYTVLKVLSGSPYEWISPHRVGDVANQMIWRDGGKYALTYFQQNVKQFLCGVNDMKPETVESMSEQEFMEACLEACGPEQPLKGWVVRTDIQSRPDKEKVDENGNVTPGARIFTTPYWYPQLTAAEIQADLDQATIERFHLLG